MDTSGLKQGERIAGISGIALLLIMFIFSWFKVKTGTSSVGGVPVQSISVGRDAWESFGFIDIILFLSAIGGIALAAVSATRTRLDVPLSTIVAGVSALGTLLVLFRVLSPPDFNIPDGLDIDVGRSFGLFLGLIASGALTYGAYMTMQEEGTTIGDVGERLSGGNEPRGPAPPPPPPPR